MRADRLIRFRREALQMIHRQQTSNAFTFVRIAALRTVQLTRGCVARVPASHRHSITAQLEVAAGKILFTQVPDPKAL